MTTDPLHSFLGESQLVQDVRFKAGRVAETPLPILLRGETGTGKEVMARAIHAASGRTGAFVAVDCAAIAATLVESELFGHVRGAFTGAQRDREGLVAAAEGGTLFLDEIAELKPELQTRLLRLLQEGTWRPVGADTSRQSDVRVLAATWKDLAVEVEGGRFRRDLYHRLAVVELVLPALRDRPDDILPLCQHFLAVEATAAGRPTPGLTPVLQRHLRRLAWPGNVRQLRNTMAYLAVVPGRAQLEIDDLPPRLRRRPSPTAATRPPPVRTDLPYMDARRLWLDTFQRLYLLTLLAEHDDNISAAARAAGLDRRTIQRTLARLRDDDVDEV
jgi:two-component system response regulator HydG